MNAAARDAMALMRDAAHSGDPDARTSLCDARAALCLANGVAVDDLDPTTGHDYSADAYGRVRTQWRWFAGMHGLTEYTRPWYEQAHAKWVAHRPDLAGGDDWLAGVVKPETDPEED